MRHDIEAFRAFGIIRRRHVDEIDEEIVRLVAQHLHDVEPALARHGQRELAECDLDLGYGAWSGGRNLRAKIL